MKEETGKKRSAGLLWPALLLLCALTLTGCGGAQTADVPPSSPTAEAAAPAAQRVSAFFAAWQQESVPDMLALCAPAWVKRQQSPEGALLALILDRTPGACDVVSVSGSEGDLTRTVTVQVRFVDRTGAAAEERLQVPVEKSDGVWYVDPAFLSGSAPESGQEDGVRQVYYNPRGGKYYHGKSNCPSVDKQYLPMTAIPWELLNTRQYYGLVRCPLPECGAPERPPLK